MSDLQFNRVFRFLVCLLLVLSLLVNLSPLKAEATAVVASALTFEGLMAALFSMSIGVVAVDLTAELWNKIGQDLDDSIITNVDTTLVQDYLSLKEMFNNNPEGPSDDGTEWHTLLQRALNAGILAQIGSWLCTLVNMGGYEVEGDVAATGWTYYGDYYLPTFPDVDGCSYVTLSKSTSGYAVYFTPVPLYDWSYAGDKYAYRILEGINFYYINISQSALDNWNISSSYTLFGPTAWKAAFANGSNLTYLWSNYDFFSYEDNSLVASGSEPSSTKTEIIEPSIYVGDIPDQIQNGDKDENNLDLPIIDPFRVIQSPGTALDDVNQLQQQLMNGTTTLDEYLQQVQLQEPTQPDNPSTDPTSPTSPSVDPDPWEPPEDPGKFALDLSKVFPFCIPFDLYAFLTCLNADPVTPVINWEIAMPGGGSYPLTIDLSPFDSVAQLLRRLELLLFCVGLAMKTRDLIKG